MLAELVQTCTRNESGLGDFAPFFLHEPFLALRLLTSSPLPAPTPRDPELIRPALACYSVSQIRAFALSLLPVSSGTAARAPGMLAAQHQSCPARPGNCGTNPGLSGGVGLAGRPVSQSGGLVAHPGLCRRLIRLASGEDGCLWFYCRCGALLCRAAGSGQEFPCAGESGSRRPCSGQAGTGERHRRGACGSGQPGSGQASGRRHGSARFNPVGSALSPLWHGEPG